MRSTQKLVGTCAVFLLNVLKSDPVSFMSLSLRVNASSPPPLLPRPQHVGYTWRKGGPSQDAGLSYLDLVRPSELDGSLGRVPYSMDVK